MLTERETVLLAEELAATAEALGQVISENAGALMAADLSVYPFAALRRALSRVRMEHAGRLTQQAIIQRLEVLAGRLTPNEAWALALAAQDEEATVVWNDEIQQAWSQVRVVAEGRDKVGARMAFLAAYERITAQARELQKLPRAVVSIGWDAQQRAAAIERAVACGLLSHEQASQYAETLALPAPAFNPLALLEGGGAPKSAPPELQAKLNALRDELASRAGRFTRQQVMARQQRMHLGRAKRATAQAVAQYRGAA